MPVHHVVHHLALNLFFSPRPCLFCGSFAGLFPFVYIILEERDTTETVITEPRRVHLSSEQMLFFFSLSIAYFLHSTLPLIHGMS